MADDNTIPLVPLDEEDEEQRQKLSAELAELGRGLISETGAKVVIPLEHRENLPHHEFLAEHSASR